MRQGPRTNQRQHARGTVAAAAAPSAEQQAGAAMRQPRAGVSATHVCPLPNVSACNAVGKEGSGSASWAARRGSEAREQGARPAGPAASARVPPIAQENSHFEVQPKTHHVVVSAALHVAVCTKDGGGAAMSAAGRQEPAPAQPGLWTGACRGRLCLPAVHAAPERLTHPWCIQERH